MVLIFELINPRTLFFVVKKYTQEFAGLTYSKDFMYEN
jgi:hypothetical protein